ncbi:hypothetical protein [Halobellus rufus]|uniref:hypothetical protein n=1 Tax=Halobellus rufus TaxID=1448860 RepID=UPI000678443B|nr:hypothetical protein [Halobellus rufus]
MELTPRRAGLIALLALLPVLAFGIFRTWWAGVITLVNVVIIAVSLYLLLSPTEGEAHGEGHGDHANGVGTGDETL